MYHNEGLCFCVEFALFDGFWPASHDVAHVIIRDVCCAQGKLGQNVSVVCDPFSCSRQGSGGEGSVYCYTNSTQQIIMEECAQNKNTFIASLLQVSEVVSQRSKCIFLNEQTTNFFHANHENLLLFSIVSSDHWAQEAFGQLSMAVSPPFVFTAFLSASSGISPRIILGWVVWISAQLPWINLDSKITKLM